MLHASILHRVQQIHAAEKVRLVIDLRFLRRLADEGLTCKMKNAFDGVLIEDVSEVRWITEVSLDERSFFDEGAVPG